MFSIYFIPLLFVFGLLWMSTRTARDDAIQERDLALDERDARPATRELVGQRLAADPDGEAAQSETQHDQRGPWRLNAWCVVEQHAP